jgi:hypothetical protein
VFPRVIEGAYFDFAEILLREITSQPSNRTSGRTVFGRIAAISS